MKTEAFASNLKGALVKDYKTLTGKTKLPKVAQDALLTPPPTTTFLLPQIPKGKKAGQEQSSLNAKHQALLEGILRKASNTINNFFQKQLGVITNFDHSPSYLQFPSQAKNIPPDSIARFHPLLDAVDIGIPPHLAPDTKMQLLNAIFGREDLLSKYLKTDKVFEITLHELIHRVGAKSNPIQNGIISDNVRARIGSLIGNTIENNKEELDLSEFNSNEMRSKVFDEAFTKLLEMIISPHEHENLNSVISSQYLAYLRATVLTNFGSPPYHIGIEGFYPLKAASEIPKEDKLKFLSDVFRLFLLPTSDFEQKEVKDNLLPKLQTTDSIQFIEDLLREQYFDKARIWENLFPYYGEDIEEENAHNEKFNILIQRADELIKDLVNLGKHWKQNQKSTELS